MTKKNTITVNDYQKSLSFLITNRGYEKIKKEDGKKMENFHEKEKNKEKEIVNVHFIQKNEKNDSSKLKKNPETAIQKRYSNLKNIINYRSSENTLFLDNMLNVKSNNIKVKTQKKQIKKSNINIKLLKFFKLWEKFSKKSIYLKNFEKLKSKNFLANSLISKEFKILLAEFSFAETINPIISNLDFNNISSNIMDSKQLLENELNNKVISFLNKMKKTIDYHGQNDVSLLNRSTRKTNEIFRKKRTYSLNLMQMPKVKLIKNEEKNKIALRNLLLHFFCRLFEELYQINLFLALSIIEVLFSIYFNLKRFHFLIFFLIILKIKFIFKKFYGANQLYFPGNFQIIDEKIIFNPLSGSFLNKINDTVASLKFDILKEIKIKEFIFFFSKILKFDLFEMVKKTKKITGAQNFQIALKQLHQKIFDNYKTINNFEIGLKNLKNNLSTSENTKNESLEQFLKYIIFFLNFKKDFYKFFDSNWNSSFFTLNKIDAFGQIFEKDLKNFNKVLMIKMPIFLEEYFKNIREEIKNFKNLYQSVNFAPITFKKREGLESILQEITKNSIFLAEILKLLADHTEQIHKTILDLNDETVKILEDIPLLLSEFDEHTIINLNLFEEKINTQLNEKKEHLDNFTKNFDEQFTKLEGSFLLNCELCFCQLKLKEAVLKNHEQDILHIINVYQEVMSNIPTLVSNSKNTVIEQIKSQVNHAWSLFTIIYEFWNKLNESFQKLSKTINIIFSNIKFEEVLKGLKDQEISFNLMMQDKNLIRFQSILLKSIIEIQSLLIKIQKLEFITYPYINEHYLNLIFDILSCEKEVMYLSEILKRPIEDKLPKITDILKIAQKEYTLKLIIEEIKISWQNNKFFEIEQTHFLTISNINSLVDDCDKDINQLEEKTKLEDNLYFSPTFLQFSHDTNNYLHNVKKKLKVWRKFQCKNYDICRYLNFAKLNNLDINEIFLLISDVQTILVSQGNEFLISSHIFNKKYYEIFNKIEKNFEELKNKIVESLQNCRILFPRFNFLNDNDLINFFLEDNHQNAKKPMISSVFPGASRLLIESEERTIGMLGSNEEFFKFDTGVIKNDVNLIEYLIEIEEEMKRSFGNSIINSINLFALHSLEEWIFDAPSQIILASLHMIVSHELYEMYKQTNSDVNNEDSSYESQISMNPEKKGSVILPEKKLIFHKNPKSEGVYFLKNKKDIEEMFGRNVDNNILGVDKFENLEILQQKSFRGLLLRLQFWVNQISKLLSQLKYNEIDYGIKEKKIKNVEKILLFIIYLKECVYEMYQKMITCQIEEYEFKKHLKILVEPQTNHLIAECGGLFYIFFHKAKIFY